MVGMCSSALFILFALVDGEDMDISPGGTAPEESRLAEQACTTSDLQSADPYTAVGSSIKDSTSNLTFLNTLAKLQQALQQLTADKLSSGNSSKAVPSSVLSLLSTLPSVIYKLKSAGESRTSTLCQSQPVEQQQITLQGQSSCIDFHLYHIVLMVLCTVSCFL